MVMEVSKQSNPRDPTLSLPNRAESEELARVFKALSDPSRVAILQILRNACGGSCAVPEEGSTVSEIACCFELALSTVSHHLKELRNAGLIDCVKRGQWVHCSANEETLERVARFIGL
jgi:ArsR family transcriptional regulator, arsenate/arsenite/antimonite-responsive transcriptional repressor